jgi:hypothetical protein
MTSAPNEDGDETTVPTTKKPRLSLLATVTPTMGRVTVAKYRPGKTAPVTPGFRNVVIHTSGTPLGGDLSPYVLRNESGCLLENVWQFSKIYARVAAQTIKLSRFHPDVTIWTHGTEQHIGADGKSIEPAYWAWRRKGMANAQAVRYPNGFHGRHQVVASVWMVNGKLRWLDYIAARKHIYCGEYRRLAPLTPHFAQLRSLLLAGENLQIVEVDGPDPSLEYGPYARISAEAPGMPMDEATIRFLVNDAKKPFGHGFVIAALLLGGDAWLLPEEE